MTKNRPNIDLFMNDNSKVAFLAGIGGVSMSSLAEVLNAVGVTVIGCDSRESDAIEILKKKGITVHIGHDAQNVKGADYVIRTSAIKDDNPEIAYALSNGIPVYERAEAWGSIMQKYKNAICISGTHGKTTTTSMMTHIAMEAQTDPTIMIGGSLPLIGGGHRVGNCNRDDSTIVLESCEYKDSFLYFSPTVAVILNVDADHLDYFKDLDDVEKSFREFAEKVPKDTGVVVANADDENTQKCLEGIDRRVITFGMGNYADVYPKSIGYSRGLPTFDIMFGESEICRVKLLVPGKHNVMNALACAAAALACGFPSDAIKNGLSSFGGVGRRFEFKGEFAGAMVYDDYSHHPNEIHALLDAVEEMGFKRIILAFQPHTFSRTKAFFDDFVRELKRADVLILADIFAAREQNTYGVTSDDIAAQIEGAYLIPDFDEMKELICKISRPGDIVLTVGAGELNIVSQKIVDEGKKSGKKQRDIFDYDVEPGGLHNVNEIKLLVCYLIDVVGCPLKKTLLFEALQTDALASYWNIAQAVSELVSQGVVVCETKQDDEYLTLNPDMSEPTKLASSSIRKIVKDKAALQATRLVARARALEDHKIENFETQNGLYMSITVCDGDFELLKVTLPIHDEFQANVIKEKFLADPTNFYRSVINVIVE